MIRNRFRLVLLLPLRTRGITATTQINRNGLNDLCSIGRICAFCHGALKGSCEDCPLWGAPILKTYGRGHLRMWPQVISPQFETPTRRVALALYRSHHSWKQLLRIERHADREEVIGRDGSIFCSQPCQEKHSDRMQLRY